MSNYCISPYKFSPIVLYGSVTTVGGTQGIPEIAAPFSGGGFSNYVSLNPLPLIFFNKHIDMENQSLPDRTGRMRVSRTTSITFPAANTKGSSTRACPSFPYYSILFTGLVFDTSLSLPTTAPAVYVHPSRFLYNHPLIGCPLSFSQAYPDVSAQSRRYLIYFQGLAGLISGTSASAPTFAGIVALLNDANLAAGKPPLGFLNPMLYSIGTGGLNDITQGNARGCGTPGFSVRSLLFLSSLSLRM